MVLWSGRRGGLGASPGRLGAGGPRAGPPIPLLRAPSARLRLEGAKDPVVLGKSQDGFDAVQPRGAPAGTSEQVASEREAGVGHGGGAARQVHGRRGRLEGAARALGSAACFGERKEVRSRFPVRTSNPRGSDPRSSSKGDAGSGCERWIWARSPPAAAWVPVGVGSSDSPEQGLRVLKPESRLSPAPPLWPRTQPHPLDPSPRSWAGLSLVQPQGPLPATPGRGRTPNIPPPTLDPLQTVLTHRGPAVGRLTGVGFGVRGPRPLVLPQLGCRLLSHRPPSDLPPS